MAQGSGSNTQLMENRAGLMPVLELTIRFDGEQALAPGTRSDSSRRREPDCRRTIAEIGDEMTKAAHPGPTQTITAADPYALAARIALSLCGLVAAVTMAAVLYIQLPSLRAKPAATSLASYESAQQRWSTAMSEPAGEPMGVANPVRIANPFDETEVFEFPAGTTDAEARAAMTEVLMERARERYVRLESQPHRREAAGS